MLLENEKDSLIDSLPANYKRVYGLIGEGSDNPTPVKYITSITGICDPTVREIVSDMVTNYGMKIGSSTQYGKHGFYKILTHEELEDNCRVLFSRATKIIQRAKALQNMVNSNQTTIHF